MLPRRSRLYPIIFALVAMCASTSSFALPLLSENAKQLYNNILTLHPDHEDPNHFYYMPNASEFAHDSGGLPLFGFTYWGLDRGSPQTGGAFMTFTMRLTDDKPHREALDAFLRSGRQISVLPVVESTVMLSTDAGTGQRPLADVFKEFNFARRGGRADDWVGVNAILTGSGAVAMRKSIDNPAFMKIDYCYLVEGLGPNFDATVEIDWTRTYRHFESHSSGGYGWWFRADVHSEVERLWQNNNIRITINGGDGKDEEYVKSVADKIVARLFQPDLAMKPVTGTSDGWSFSRLRLKHTDKQELKKETFKIKRRELVKREYCVPLSLYDLKRYRSEVVRNADNYSTSDNE